MNANAAPAEPAKPAAKLRLVDEAMAAALAESPDERLEDPAKKEAVRKTLNRFAPSIAKIARQDERAEIMRQLGVQRVEEAGLIAAIEAKHEQRVQEARQALERQMLAERRAAHRSGVLQGAVPAAIAAGSIVWAAMQLGMFSQVFVDKAREEGRGLQLQDAPDAYTWDEYERGRREPEDAP